MRSNGRSRADESLANFETGCRMDEMRPGRFVRIVGGETLVSTHGITESRYEALSSKRTSAKAAEDLEKEEGSFKYARGSSRSASWASWSSGASNAVSRTWRSLTRRSARCCSTGRASGWRGSCARHWWWARARG